MQVKAVSTGSPRKWDILFLSNHPGPRASDPGPYPKDFLVSPWIGTPQPLWEAYGGNPWSLSWLKRGSSWSLLCFCFCPLLPPISGHHLLQIFVKDSPQPFPPLDWTVPALSAFPHRRDGPVPSSSLCCLIKNSPVSISLLFWGALYWTHMVWYGVVFCREDGSPPHSSGSTPNAAQDMSAILTAGQVSVSWSTRTSGAFSAKLLSNQVVPITSWCLEMLLPRCRSWLSMRFQRWAHFFSVVSLDGAFSILGPCLPVSCPQHNSGSFRISPFAETETHTLF